MASRVLPLFLIPVLFAVDRLTKLWVIRRLSEGDGFPVWEGVFHITRVNNTGAAFGIFKGASQWLVLIAAASILVLGVYLSRRFFDGQNTGKAAGSDLAWALVAAGAMGNLYDRLRFGYVIDFLDLRVWPVFNVADTSICLGVAWIALGFFSTLGSKSTPK